MTFADKLVQLRKAAGFSQEDLAEKLNLTRQAVYKWESGVAMPDIDNLKLLASLFKVSIDLLLNDEAELPQSLITVPTPPSYGKVIRTGVSMRNVDIESINSRLTPSERGTLKKRRVILAVLLVAMVVSGVFIIFTLINLFIGGIVASCAAFLVSIIAYALVDKYYGVDVYGHRTYFFMKQKQIVDVLKKKNYWYVPLQYDLLVYFFYDAKTRSFGFYFSNKEQFICPIQNYASFSCGSFGQGTVLSGTQTSTGVMLGSLQGFSISQTPTYAHQNATFFDFTLFYYDENGKTCQYNYTLSSVRKYTFDAMGSQEGVIQMSNYCSENTMSAFTKIRAKLEVEKNNFNQTKK